MCAGRWGGVNPSSSGLCVCVCEDCSHIAHVATICLSTSPESFFPTYLPTYLPTCLLPLCLLASDTCFCHFIYVCMTVGVSLPGANNTADLANPESNNAPCPLPSMWVFFSVVRFDVSFSQPKARCVDIEMKRAAERFCVHGILQQTFCKPSLLSRTPPKTPHQTITDTRNDNTGLTKFDARYNI